MARESFKEKAKQTKAQISRAVLTKHLNPLSRREDAFHNPIAYDLNRNALHLDTKTKSTIQESNESAKLVITPKNQQILLNYFISRRNEHDKLGNYYKTLSFSEFILRLSHQRFKTIYYDGRAIILRDGASKTGEGKAFLDKLGTNADRENLFRDYLTLEESVLSPLIIPQATSIMIGTGSRTHEDNWNIKQEFEDSIDTALISYPAAAEIRNGQTAHYDCIFIVKPERPSTAYLNRLNAIRANPALMIAAIEIYGNEFAFEAEDDAAFEKIIEGGQTHYLHKQAYLKRTENMLKSTLLAADAQMAKDGLGTTFQLKGLGLGAFSFASPVNTLKIQRLYLQALKNVLRAKDMDLKHIQTINLINLPSDLGDNAMRAGDIKEEFEKKGIHVIRSVMDPSAKTNQDQIGEIGGVVVCGDSGSKFGNEGNIGLDRKSSDDPAAQYSLLNPLILDAAANPVLRDENCIQVVDEGQFKALMQTDLPQIAVRRAQIGLLGRSRNYLLIASLFTLGVYFLSPLLLVPTMIDLSFWCLQCALVCGVLAVACEVADRIKNKVAPQENPLLPLPPEGLPEAIAQQNEFTPMMRHRRARQRVRADEVDVGERLVHQRRRQPH